MCVYVCSCAHTDTLHSDVHKDDTSMLTTHAQTHTHSHTTSQLHRTGDSNGADTSHTTHTTHSSTNTTRTSHMSTSHITQATSSTSDSTDNSHYAYAIQRAFQTIESAVVNGERVSYEFSVETEELEHSYADALRCVVCGVVAYGVGL